MAGYVAYKGITECPMCRGDKKITYPFACMSCWAKLTLKEKQHTYVRNHVPTNPMWLSRVLS